MGTSFTEKEIRHMLLHAAADGIQKTAFNCGMRVERVPGLDRAEIVFKVHRGVQSHNPTYVTIKAVVNYT